MKRMFVWMVLVLVVFYGGIFSAEASEGAKRTLKGNMTEVYRQLPGDATDVAGMFSEGIFYGRIRINSFRWDWEEETDGKIRDNWSVGVGGSMLFKSAYYYGAGLSAGLYTSMSPWHMAGDGYRHVRSGKDVFSRYQVATSGDYDMAVLAQAYLEYRFMNTSIRAGRQIFESLLTKSNDTKMIPNTFEGIVLESNDIKNTWIKAAWLHRQKLRDHTSFHHVLARGDDPGTPDACWTENDDSAMHRGLTMSRLKAEGINDELFVLQVENRAVPNLTIMANVTDVPDLVGTVTGEVNYRLSLAGGIKLVPGIRYMIQSDHGGGKIGGASLIGRITVEDDREYSDPWNLDSSLFAARISLSKGAGSFLLGYSKVIGDADLVTPWRGFPTSGYTRAMGQYNWFAGTETLMVQAGYDFSEAGVVSGLSVKARYAIQDFDDHKPDVPPDSKILNIDFLKTIDAVPGLMIKLRTGFFQDDSDAVAMNGARQAELSYNEYRLEMNFLF